LNDNFAEIENTLRRFTVALSAAVDPEMYRKEYLKKLYKLLDVSGEKDPLSYFAKYSAGELPKAALKSFVRQAQLERGVKRGKEEPQQEPQGVDTRVDYELYDRTTDAVIDTFPARNDDEARVRLDDYRSWPGASNPDNFGVRRAGRNQPTDQLPVWYVSIIGRPGTEIQVRADNESDARREAMRMRFDIFGDESIGNIRASTVGVRQAGTPTTEQYYDVTWTDGGSESMVRVRAPNANAAMDRIRSQSPSITDIEANPSRYQDAPGSTADLQRQRAAAAQQPAPQPAPQQPGMGQWNGQWKVLVNGQEVYRFGNIGNSQADANRIAAAWLRQNGQGVSGEGFEVYPVMAESLREYKMPQPSQGPGKYRDLNEPLGPEFPPTMPAGTVKVDVSDVYDWYKLGQHISNMKDLGQHDFGQGPPSAILSFGDEDLEHQYIQALKKTGLTTTDIDPVDPDQPADMPRQKTDPTYNVDEAFDQPYKTKSEKSEYGDIDMLARLPDGTNLSIMFNQEYNGKGEEVTQVEFYRNNSQEVTGEGDAQRIFATVLTSIQKYIKKYKPARLSFSASKATDPTIYYEPDQPQPNPESRAKLYDRLVQRYAKAWGYRAFRADTGDLVIYELSRLQPAVAENFADGRNPQDKGDAKRHGINTKASVSSLRKTAKQGGRKGQLAHWLANMKAGRAKAKRK
jgi:hypothetical protein